MNKELLEQKWAKFRQRVKVFNHVPFVELVFGAGSMAMGTAKESSDFDVIVGTRKGRMFTARIISVFLFNLKGWRRNKYDSKDLNESKDKICLNHFVTPESYRLSPPHNIYWETLYERLIPLIGSKEKINEFFSRNDWVKNRPNYKGGDLGSKSNLKIFLEFILNGRFGDIIEKIFRVYQMKRIERGIKNTETFKPRIINSETELELHPHMYRAEDYVRQMNDPERKIH